MWVYHSSIGPLYIVPTGDGLFGFLYNGIIWEACPTPQIEADNVYCRRGRSYSKYAYYRSVGRTYLYVLKY